MKIAIVDVLGLSYDGSTLEKRGLGGSESAVILMAKELVNVGFDVTVYNDCGSDDSVPGKYDGVMYRPLSFIEGKTLEYDIIIASRSVAAFSPPELKQSFKSFVNLPNFDNFKAKYKVLWMHDTFCDGDQLIEPFLVAGRIDKVFTLSDFHTSYTSNCDHGGKRMFETMKNYIFQTRNGMKKHIDWVDVRDKDPDLFVYNASVSKGMIPLIERVWPEFLERVPHAKLKVIGGYYKFRDDSPPDELEEKYHDLVAKYGDRIDFTGIIPQKEIAEILAKASYMIYPAAFPETFGISTLESLFYNTPLVTCNFGALEETAIDIACYKIPYPIVPNSLFPNISTDFQVERFVNMLERAYNDKYLHQQKMYACNQIKGICTWDTVALQWKQHFYKALGDYLPVAEYRKVSKINHDVHKVFGRRFSNPEELQEPRYRRSMHIDVIVPVYNAEKYIERCIKSIAAQDYPYYSVWIIDDCSTDNTYEVANRTIQMYDNEGNFDICKNEENKGAVCNQIETMLESVSMHCGASIVMLVDGDDWLVNDPNIFHKINNLYQEGAEFTYGSCWSVVDNIPLIAQPYPPEVKQNKSYRDYRFAWNMPYTHLRTFSSDLVKRLEDTSAFKDENGDWLKAGGDTAVFYTMLEMANPDKVVCIPDILYNYNDANPLNDYKVNGEEQTKNARNVMKKAPLKDNALEIINNDWPAIKSSIIDHVTDWSVCVQAGGHYGTYPKRLSELFNIVYTFEADIDNYEILNRACTEKNIFKFNAALSAYSHRVGITRVSEGNSGQNYVIDGNDVNAITIDSLNLNACGLIQLDIERHELFALMGAIETIEKYHPVIILEGPETTNNSCNAILEQLGYIEVSRAGVDTVFKYVNAQRPSCEYTKSNDNLTKKKILIAIPTAKYIEVQTFKSIYDLEVPDGYEVDFQYFYGYAVDQVRNLIASWVVNSYDYLFAVDHDVTFAPDTLKKMLSHDKHVVSGIYRQRLEPQVIEIYDKNFRNVPYESLANGGLIEIGGCGFGCVLVKKEVLESVGYPQFVYHQTLDFANTFSEDLDFCRKATAKGYGVWVDTSIICGHIGERVFQVEMQQPPKDLTGFKEAVAECFTETSEQIKLRELGNMKLLPQTHIDYLLKMKENGINPKVIYDIGACVLHWTNEAKHVWNDSEYVLFEAMDAVKFLYDETDHRYSLGVLSDQDYKMVSFNENTEHPGGNSYYDENVELSPRAAELFPSEKKVQKVARTLDNIVKSKKFPLPDLIKMDVQGAELDILRGAEDVIKSCKDIILEMQTVDYNIGAPKVQEITDYLISVGFVKVGGMFCGGFMDGDYHFTRAN
jgi:FkbM family methyltransferase